MRRYVFRLAILSLAVLGPTVGRADDQEIAQQIVQKLQAEKQAGTLKGFSIDLSVEEGTVWLSGRVPNAEQQAKALDIARRIPGVKQVVNDLAVTATNATPASPAKPRNVFANMTNAVRGVMNRQTASQDQSELQAAAATEDAGAIGSGVAHATGARPIVQVAQPVVQPVVQTPAYADGGQQYYNAQSYGTQATPVYAGSRSQVPLAFAPARQAAYQGAVAGMPGSPMPMHMPGSGVGIAPARYDHPQMPGYAWPSYAAHPNYAAVTYPKQYSPTAWPYIGPFYPYPQVPLGWRKVTLEWDDGWWMLDFKDRRTMYNH
ncbi:MAG: BON domain-containing protein [Pirellulaceae bacterium]